MVCCDVFVWMSLILSPWGSLSLWICRLYLPFSVRFFIIIYSLFHLSFYHSSFTGITNQKTIMVFPGDPHISEAALLLEQIIPIELPISSFPCQVGQFWAIPVIPLPHFIIVLTLSSLLRLLSLFWCCLMKLLSSFLSLLDRISCSPLTVFIRAGDRLCHVSLT